MDGKDSKASFPKAALLALGHFINDLYPAFLPPLLPLLVEKFQLTFTRAGILATVLSFSSSMTQPLFGYLADRLGGRTLILLGPLVCGVSLSFIGAVRRVSALFSLPSGRSEAKNNKNLTAGVGEYAEVEMAKCSAPICGGKSGRLSHPAWAKWL